MDMGEGKITDLECMDYIYNQILTFKHSNLIE